MEASPHFRLEPSAEQAVRTEAPIAQLINIVRKRSSARESALRYDQLHGSVPVPGCEGETPWTLNIPHELDSPSIHLIVPGFGGFKRSSRDLRNTLSAQEKFASLSFDPVRKSGESDLWDSQKAHKDTIPAILADLASNRELRNTAKGGGLDMSKVVLVPHSMGGISAVEHAVRKPSEVSHMVLMAIVGLEGKVGLGYGPRLVNSGRREIMPAISRGSFGGWSNAPNMAKRAFKYYLGNPSRTIGEVASLFEVDLRPQVAAIGALGIGLAMYHFERDELVDSERSINRSGDLVDHTEIALGLDHLAPQTHPWRVAADVGRISRHLAALHFRETTLSKAA